MSTKLDISGLNETTTAESIKTHLQQFGVVEDVIITYDNKQQSQGTARVMMPSAESAMKTITSLNGKDFEGRRITIRQARPLRNRL